MKSLKLSFAGGEISPEMVGRLDSRQYQSGAAKVSNYLPLPQGPVTRRPGSRFVANQFSSSPMSLIPFVYSTDQSLVIELRGVLIRFFTNGQQLLYATPHVLASWDTDAETAIFGEEHGFVEDEEIQFVVAVSDTLPTGITRGVTYFVNVIDSYTIKVGTSSPAASSLVALGGTPAGTTRAFNNEDHPAEWVGSTDYVRGDLMYWTDSGNSSDLDHGVYYCQLDHTAHASDPFNDTASWYQQPTDGQLVIPTAYSGALVKDIRYAQSNDVVTLVHPSYPPFELRRRSAKNWAFKAIVFGSKLTPPVQSAVVVDRGQFSQITSVSGLFDLASLMTFSTDHSLGSGDSVYLDVQSGTNGLLADGYYVVNKRYNERQLSLKSKIGVPVDISTGGGNGAAVVLVYFSSLSADNEQSYKITAVDSKEIETIASNAAAATNNIDVTGATNTLAWAAVTGAEKYRIYREQNGLYAFIGESETLTFEDDGIDVDLGRTPPIADTDLSGSDYPRAVGYYQQRRVFAGTVLKGNNYWMTKSGTESDMTYSLPIQDDDRISASIAARDGIVIQHIVPMRRGLAMLTQQSEWIVDGGDSRALTPTTVGNDSLEDTGANNVRPLKIGGAIVFAAARGGHVHTIRLNAAEQGLTVDDLSLRATHLFDGKTILDSTFSKAPYPVLWFVSSSGKLISLTYLPREEVAGFAVHDLGEGAIAESVCSIPEGEQDSVYVAVRRTVNGTEARYIERLVPQVTESLTDSVYLDASQTTDGTNTGTRTLTLSGGTLWAKNETVTVTASAHLFRATDIGDEIELTDLLGAKYRARLSALTSSTVVTGVLLADVPTAMRQTSATTWAFARRVIDGLAHLEGVTVSIMADGVQLADQVVVDGAITLPVAAVKSHVGRNFVSELRTLPITIQQMEAAGQGRSKNIGTAHLRVLESAGMSVGSDPNHLVPIEGMTATALTTGEQRAVPRGVWTQGGEFIVRQDKPLPSTVLGITLDVEMGG